MAMVMLMISHVADRRRPRRVGQRIAQLYQPFSAAAARHRSPGGSPRRRGTRRAVSVSMFGLTKSVTPLVHAATNGSNARGRRHVFLLERLLRLVWDAGVFQSHTPSTCVDFALRLNGD
jgi:hypothetical protein